VDLLPCTPGTNLLLANSISRAEANVINDRKDYTLAQYVQAGIALDHQYGSARAWSYMQSFDVPLAIIRRVLAYPDQRRGEPAAANGGMAGASPA
jgi:hypothetical protein